MRVGILVAQTPFVYGRAETQAQNLCAALRAAGHDAELIGLPFSWCPPNRIAPQMLAALLLDITETSGMRIDRVIGLQFPAYLMPHPDKVLWLSNPHRTAADIWGQDLANLAGPDGGNAAMHAIQEAETRLFPEVKRVFTQSARVGERLRQSFGLVSQPLYHPPPLDQDFTCAEPEDFFLMPGPIHNANRHSLIIEALFRVRKNVQVRIAGPADFPAPLERLRAQASALPSDRVKLLGRVNDAERLSLYARCLGVISIPLDDDQDDVTLEAMLAAKPVITCSDSRNVMEFVVGGETALISEPSPEALADNMDRLWSGRPRARHMGQQGRAHYDRLGISWDNVVATLLG